MWCCRKWCPMVSTQAGRTWFGAAASGALGRWPKKHSTPTGAWKGRCDSRMSLQLCEEIEVEAEAGKLEPYVWTREWMRIYWESRPKPPILCHIAWYHGGIQWLTDCCKFSVTVILVLQFRHSSQMAILWLDRSLHLASVARGCSACDFAISPPPKLCWRDKSLTVYRHQETKHFHENLKSQESAPLWAFKGDMGRTGACNGCDDHPVIAAVAQSLRIRSSILINGDDMLILANHLGLCACLKREGGAST